MRPRELLHRWRFTIGYLVAVVVLTGISAVWAHHDIVRLHHARYEQCLLQEQLRRNQVLVVKTLDEWAETFKDRTSVGLTAVPNDLLNELKQRVRKLAQTSHRCVP